MHSHAQVQASFHVQFTRNKKVFDKEAVLLRLYCRHIGVIFFFVSFIFRVRKVEKITGFFSFNMLKAEHNQLNQNTHINSLLTIKYPQFVKGIVRHLKKITFSLFLRRVGGEGQYCFHVCTLNVKLELAGD